MNKESSEIKGLQFFETEVEKSRIKELINLIREIIPGEEIITIMPNMIKDANGKTRAIGFFIFMNKMIVEFKNFLTTIDFDYASWERIYDVRMKLRNYKIDILEDKIPILNLDIYHSDLHSDITVFGENLCNYVYEFAKILYRRLGLK